MRLKDESDVKDDVCVSVYCSRVGFEKKWPREELEETSFVEGDDVHELVGKLDART